MKNPILVTGSHRSGSTWIGRMLALSQETGYIHEPFNLLHSPGICRAKFDYWYTYICNVNSSKYYSDLKDTLSFRYSLSSDIKHVRSPLDILRTFRDWYNFNQYRNQDVRPLVKDPIALFSTEWLEKQFDMQVVIIIRHPAAFAGSLKVANWSHPFVHFLKQPELMKDYLEPFRKEIEIFARNKRNIIDQGILLWKIFHHVIKEFQGRHQDWIFVKHEDISLNPLQDFELLYRKLSLPFTENIKNSINKYTFKYSKPNLYNDSTIRRNSRENVKLWKERLTRKEIFKIRAGTEDIANHFYTENDW